MTAREMQAHKCPRQYKPGDKINLREPKELTYEPTE
jgi:hypothetical protein